MAFTFVEVLQEFSEASRLGRRERIPASAWFVAREERKARVQAQWYALSSPRLLAYLRERTQRRRQAEWSRLTPTCMRCSTWIPYRATGRIPMFCSSACMSQSWYRRNQDARKAQYHSVVKVRRRALREKRRQHLCCKLCQAPLGGRSRTWCSNRCKSKYWNAQATDDRGPARHE